MQDVRRKAQQLEASEGSGTESSEGDETLRSNNSVSSNLSAPPGFEKLSQGITKATIREDEKTGFWQGSVEESEDTEEEVEETWMIGTRLGIGAEVEDRARRYLRSKTEEMAQKDSQRKKKADRCRKKVTKEVGVSTD
ncbi:hypothetical protein PIB30_074802 [Stylosanthes scabra]|uniref:Uncharacterized protein n=1 Tax=Stylosanthes scabra TaxID=79078 RepID=A0ABU6SPX3_9FABA|nr:hypothetical protein [Stylosanthes scabra]